MAYFGQAEETYVGSEMLDEFRPSLEQHLLYLQTEGYSASTVSSRKYFLTKLHFAYLALPHEWGERAPFNEMLAHLLSVSKLTRKAFALKFGINPSTIKPWFNGEHTPLLVHKPHLVRIEEYYSLPGGTLTAYLPKYHKHATEAYRTRQTVIGRRISINSQLRYGLRTFPQQLVNAWDDLNLFMSRPYPPKSYQRNSSWRISNGRVKTADIYRSYSSYFFGFLCLTPNALDIKMRGKGFATTELTLGMIGDSSLVEEYIEFKFRRSDGHYTNETRNFLRLSRSLLRAKTGYLAQHSEFGLTLREPIPESEWEVWCEENRARLKVILYELEEGKKFEMGRDVNEPLRKILELQHPLKELKKLVTQMKADKPSPTTGKVRHAVHNRNCLLVQLLSSNPLRIKHFSWMTWRADNTGNLYQHPAGSWWLRFESKVFKNERGAASVAYDVPVAEHLWREIEEYLFTHRPHLVGADTSDLVFLRGHTRGRGNLEVPPAPIPILTLARIVREMTQFYIPSCPGFGPHAFRHIVATEYIRNHKEGFEIAAKILHIRPETARAVYIHVKTAAYIDHWNEYLQSIWEA